MLGFGASKGFGPAPPRSGASSANVSVATSLGGFKKSNASSGVSSPSLDIIDTDSSRVPSMDPLPFTSDDAPPQTQASQVPLPLAPKKSAFGTTFGASTSASKPPTTASAGGFGSTPFAASGSAGKPFNAMGHSAAAMGAASSSSSAPSPLGSFGTGTSFTSPNARIKTTTNPGATTTPISEPSPISKSSPQTANSPSVNLSASPTPFSSPSNRNNKEEISISSGTNRSLFGDTKNDASVPNNNINSSPPSEMKKGTVVNVIPPVEAAPVTLSSRILSYDAAPGWDDERITAMKAASDFNKEKLSQLDAICMIQHTADTLVCQDAGLAIQRAAIEGWTAKIAEIGAILDESEKELHQLTAENPVMGKADGEAFGESAELQDLWYDRQDEFINLFVSHRDRYLSILRSTKLVGLGKAISATTEEARKEAWEREHVGYTNSSGRPIANKYREGKMQRTLKRELNST